MYPEIDDHREVIGRGFGDMGPLPSATLQDLAALSLILMATITVWRFFTTGK